MFLITQEHSGKYQEPLRIELFGLTGFAPILLLWAYCRTHPNNKRGENIETPIIVIRRIVQV